MGKSSCVRVVPGAARNPDLGRVPPRMGPESDPIPRARHGRLDTSVSCHHACGVATAQDKDTWPDAIDPLPPHVRIVRFLLCLPALQHLSRPRPGAGFSRRLGRRSEAPVHHGGIHGVCPDDSASHHFHCRDGSPNGLSSLADVASRDLRECRGGSDSFLLAREIRRPFTPIICGNYGRSAGLAPVRVVFRSRPPTRAWRSSTQRARYRRSALVFYRHYLSISCELYSRAPGPWISAASPPTRPTAHRDCRLFFVPLPSEHKFPAEAWHHS